MAQRKRRGKAEGSVYQRADGTWAATISMGFRGDGSRRRRTIFGKSKAHVQAKLRQLQTSADCGTLPEANSILVKQFLYTWLQAVKPSLAPYTYLAYARDCDKALIPHLGGVKLQQLTALHVQKLYSDLTNDGMSASMQKKAAITLGVALQYAVRLRLVPHNVARDVPKPRHTVPEMQVLAPEQIQAFLTAAREDRLFALYAFLIDSGTRECEAFALQWGDIDWSAGAVQIVRSLEEISGRLRLKDLKTRKSRRRIALTAFTMEALSMHRQAMVAEGNYRLDGPVFADTNGGWLRKSNVLRRSFRPILQKAGLPRIRPYDLRHSSATLLLLAGEDSKVVAERLGHSTTVLTQNTYQHVLPGMQERAAKKLDTIFRAEVLTKGNKTA